MTLDLIESFTSWAARRNLSRLHECFGGLQSIESCELQVVGVAEKAEFASCSIVDFFLLLEIELTLEGIKNALSSFHLNILIDSSD